MTDDHAPETRSGRWDPLIEHLHALRREAGEPSYAELTRRIVEQRRADGLDEHAARIAKSSVHDAFRLGRARVNLALTREIVRALGADPALVDQWAAPPEPARSPAAQTPGPAASRTQVLALIIGCLALNVLGREVVGVLRLPIYLDMVGTAIVAIVLGPWRGAAVGIATNLLGAFGAGWDFIPFGAVNVVGALVWGYGVRRWGMGLTLLRFLTLNAVAAIACSLTAVPIVVLLEGHDLGAGHIMLTRLMEQSVHDVAVAAGLSNLVSSLTDKLVTGFVALVAISTLPFGLRARSHLVPSGAPAPVQARPR